MISGANSKLSNCGCTIIEKMQSSLNIKAVNDLINMAQKTTAEANEDPSPVLTRARSVLKLGKVAEHASKLKFAVFASLQGKDSVNVDESETEAKTIPVVLNWIVSFLKDVVSKVNGQSDLIIDLIDKISGLSESRDTLEAELEKKQKELEAEIKEKSDALEKDMEEKKVAFQMEMEKKCENLEIKYDEVRQRGMKGNLIVSSPERKTGDGRLDSLAFRRQTWDNVENSYREENDLEMIVRLVQWKTGVWIPYHEVVACHPFGKKENRTYILSISNRCPGSSWDIITQGMRTGKTFTNYNIFINFQLTDRRIEVSKKVRQAKKDSLIQKYSVDANGKIWIKKLGDEKRFYEVKSIDSLQKIINNIHE